RLLLCTASQVDVVKVTSTVTGAPTWNNQPTVGGIYASASAAMGHSTSCPAGDLSLSSGGANGTSLADLVQLWSDGTTVPAQLELRAHNESSTTSGKAFTSSEGGSNGPVLAVTYNSFPAVPTTLWTERNDDGAYTLHGTFSDPDGGTGWVTYTVTDATTNTVVLAGSPGAVVASGADSHLDLPGGTINDTDSYTFTAQASDGTLSSASSSAQTV